MPTAERHLGCKPNVEGSACSTPWSRSFDQGSPVRNSWHFRRWIRRAASAWTGVHV